MARRIRLARTLATSMAFASVVTLAGARALAEDEGHGSHESAEGHDGSAAEHHLGPINWLDFGNKKQPPYAAMLLNFGVLLAIYYAVGKKKVGAALADRRAQIAKEIEEAERMKAEAQARAEKYQAQLANLSAELESTKRAIVEAGRHERERIIREAEEKAERMRRDAQTQIEQEVRNLRSEVMREAVEVATRTAEELLRNNLTDSDHARLIDGCIEQLSKGDKSATAVRASGGAASGGGLI